MHDTDQIPPVRSRRKIAGATASIALMLALAVLLAFQLDGHTDRVIPRPAATQTATTSPTPTGDPFPDAVRAEITSLTPGLTDEQINNEAEDVCNALDSRPLTEVYNTFDFPVEDPADAGTLLAMSVDARCPQWLPALQEIAE